MGYWTVVVPAERYAQERLVVRRGVAEKDVVARVLADEAVKRFVNGNPLKKVIFVQDRLVNLVV